MASPLTERIEAAQARLEAAVLACAEAARTAGVAELGRDATRRALHEAQARHLLGGAVQGRNQAERDAQLVALTAAESFEAEEAEVELKQARTGLDLANLELTAAQYAIRSLELLLVARRLEGSAD